jgi:hypothetical protein
MKPWGWPLALEIVSPSFHSRLSCLVLRVPIFISSLSLEHVFFNGLRCSLAVSFICSRNFFFLSFRVHESERSSDCIHRKRMKKKREEKIFFRSIRIFREQKRNERTEGISPKSACESFHIFFLTLPTVVTYTHGYFALYKPWSTLKQFEHSLLWRESMYCHIRRC